MEHKDFKYTATTSAEWLKARRDVVTASDIRRLIGAVITKSRIDNFFKRKDKVFEAMEERHISKHMNRH